MDLSQLKLVSKHERLTVNLLPAGDEDIIGPADGQRFFEGMNDDDIIGNPVSLSGNHHRGSPG